MIWYAIVAFGDPESTVRARLPRGPFASVDGAREALSRWRARAGWLAGTAEAAHSIRVVGPYATRREARAADVACGKVVLTEALP